MYCPSVSVGRILAWCDLFLSSGYHKGWPGWVPVWRLCQLTLAVSRIHFLVVIPISLLLVTGVGGALTFLDKQPLRWTSNVSCFESLISSSMTSGETCFPRAPHVRGMSGLPHNQSFLKPTVRVRQQKGGGGQLWSVQDAARSDAIC